MENSAARTTIKERLILAGIDEIGNCGLSEFSLRQVALACNVSCATPYNYFKNKEGFIKEIKGYLMSQWELFKTEIVSAHREDERNMLAQICVYFIKFLIANPNYRDIIMSNLENSGDFTRDFMELELEHYLKINSFGEKETKRKIFAIRAITYEAALMFENGELPNTEESFDFVRYCVKKEL